MAGKIIRTAVLGQGRSGYGIHVRWLREAKDQYQVVAVADQLPERHEAVQEFNAKAFTDYKDLLRDKSLQVDLVVNALPTHLHTEGTVAALDAGYHVLSEKPFALNVADFDKMTAAAERNERKLFAFQNSRFQPAFIEIQNLLASGKLGKLIHARLVYSSFARRWDWQSRQKFGGGNINNTGPHPLDQAIVLFGDRMPHVSSKLACSNPFGDADDFAIVTFNGKDAPVIEVVVSSFMAYPQGDTYNICCTAGGITGNATSLKWKYFDPAAAPKQAPAQGWSEKRGYNSEQLPWVEETWNNPHAADGFQQMSHGLYNNVYDAIVSGAEPVVKLSEVRRQIAVLEEVHRQNPLPEKSL